jgi:hypothetical protein
MASSFTAICFCIVDAPLHCLYIAFKDINSFSKRLLRVRSRASASANASALAGASSPVVGSSASPLESASTARLRRVNHTRRQSHIAIFSTQARTPPRVVSHPSSSSSSRDAPFRSHRAIRDDDLRHVIRVRFARAGGERTRHDARARLPRARVRPRARARRHGVHRVSTDRAARARRDSRASPRVRRRRGVRSHATTTHVRALTRVDASRACSRVAR